MDLPIQQGTFVFIDTELTGLNEREDSIISIGALRMIEGRIEMGKHFYSLVKPSSRMKNDSVVIHEITPSEVSDERSITEVLPEFLEFCNGHILVGHFIGIDLGFLNKEIKRLGNLVLSNTVLDTYILYGWLWTRWLSESQFSLPPQQVDLYKIARSFDIPFSGAHNAIMDAFITAQVFQRFIPWLERSGILNLGALLKIGNPEKGGDHRFHKPAQISNF
ncbi:MAG TPA: 3'-5' exonuclease [Thermodesulfobacteriota bacterium]|nr:3'-5' exonuclease [Thermodesulfobacteriota bacterium]